MLTADTRHHLAMPLAQGNLQTRANAKYLTEKGLEMLPFRHSLRSFWLVLAALCFGASALQAGQVTWSYNFETVNGQLGNSHTFSASLGGEPSITAYGFTGLRTTQGSNSTTSTAHLYGNGSTGTTGLGIAGGNNTITGSEFIVLSLSSLQGISIQSLSISLSGGPWEIWGSDTFPSTTGGAYVNLPSNALTGTNLDSLIGDQYIFIADSQGVTVNSLTVVDAPSLAPEPASTAAFGLVLLMMGAGLSRKAVLARRRI